MRLGSRVGLRALRQVSGLGPFRFVGPFCHVLSRRMLLCIMCS